MGLLDWFLCDVIFVIEEDFLFVIHRCLFLLTLKLMISGQVIEVATVLL